MNPNGKEALLQGYDNAEHHNRVLVYSYRGDPVMEVHRSSANVNRGGGGVCKLYGLPAPHLRLVNGNNRTTEATLTNPYSDYEGDEQEVPDHTNHEHFEQMCKRRRKKNGACRSSRPCSYGIHTCVASSCTPECANFKWWKDPEVVEIPEHIDSIRVFLGRAQSKPSIPFDLNVVSKTHRNASGVELVCT